MEDLIAVITQLLELGWPAIVLVFVYALWKELRNERAAHIQSIRDCKDKYEALINERLEGH